MTLRAGKAMGINPEIVDVSIPLLVNLNKGGVAMIAALKLSLSIPCWAWNSPPKPSS